MKRWGVVIVLSLSMFIIVIDTTIMNVSIAAFVEALDTTVQGIQAAISRYAPVMAAFMLTAGLIGIQVRERGIARGARCRDRLSARHLASVVLARPDSASIALGRLAVRNGWT